MGGSCGHYWCASVLLSIQVTHQLGLGALEENKRRDRTQSFDVGSSVQRLQYRLQGMQSRLASELLMPLRKGMITRKSIQKVSTHAPYPQTIKEKVQTTSTHSVSAGSAGCEGRNCVASAEDGWQARSSKSTAAVDVPVLQAT